MITVLMGAPAAGKSTWLKANAIGDEHIYSTEAIRIYRDIDRDMFMRTIRRNAYIAVRDGKSVIADGTHTIGQHRNYWLKIAKEFDVKTRLVMFDTPLNVLLIGNSKRLYPAPVKVIRDHHIRFVRSRELVRLEPWDQIDIILRDK
jgi:predicted kinase